MTWTSSASGAFALSLSLSRRAKIALDQSLDIIRQGAPALPRAPLRRGEHSLIETDGNDLAHVAGPLISYYIVIRNLRGVKPAAHPRASGRTPYTSRFVTARRTIGRGSFFIASRNSLTSVRSPKSISRNADASAAAAALSNGTSLYSSHRSPGLGATRYRVSSSMQGRAWLSRSRASTGIESGIARTAAAIDFSALANPGRRRIIIIVATSTHKSAGGASRPNTFANRVPRTEINEKFSAALHVAYSRPSKRIACSVSVMSDEGTMKYIHKCVVAANFD